MILARHERGLHVVALFEAAKGAIVMVVGCGLLSLIHQDLEEVAERIAAHLHINPASHYPRIFIRAASQMTDSHLWLFAALAFLYATFRFVEAYGLWRMRPWAEWLGLISGAVYIPVEIYELIQRVTWLRFLLLAANLLVVLYLAFVIYHQRQSIRPTSVDDRA
jgi:uncharacterized membrane protein (DUF2068 family)